jgi:hypothetical protein
MGITRSMTSNKAATLPAAGKLYLVVNIHLIHCAKH